MKKILFGLLYILWGGVFTANADVTIYVNSTAANYYMHVWDGNGNLTGDWPGTQFSDLSTTTVDGTTYYYKTFTGSDSLNVVFNTGSGDDAVQTGNIQNITEDTYFTYNSSNELTIGRASSTTESITVYVSSTSSSYYLYAWNVNSNSDNNLTSSWPGTQFSDLSTTTVNGTTYYYTKFDVSSYSTRSIGVILDTGNGTNDVQTGNIFLTSDAYISYSGGTTCNITLPSSSDDDEGTTYYLVADGGAKCKFTPDRVRNGGSLDYDNQNLHLQDFIIQADGNTFLTDGYLQFHIEDASGNKYCFTSTTDDNVLEDTATTNYTGSSKPFNGPITSDTYFDASYSSAAKLYWVSMSTSGSTDFKIKAGAGASYTFLWQPKNSGLYLIVNGEEFGDAAGYYDGTTRKTVANYYLIGNFSSANANTDIDPSTSDNRRMLTPYYYKGGDEYGGSMTDCDSIVYKIEVARPSAGWSEFYLDLVNESDFSDYSSSEWSNNTTPWTKVIRPEATWSSSGAAYALDATALTGGLMRNENSSYQSLNPVVSDTIDSYVFTMNAKTSTYSIRFVSAATNDVTTTTEEDKSYLYIFGTAVDSSDGSTTSDNWSDANAFKLTYDSDGGYYYYAGSDGEEAEIPMVANGKFAFVTDMDFSKGYYTEDGNVPPSLIEETTTDGTTTYTSTESSKYGANTAGGFYETQYVNMLGTNRTAEAAAYDSESIRTITWGLPSGDYYIRFYVGAKNGEYAKNLYTVRRSYRLLRPDANEVTINGTQYTTFKVFCDSNAVIVPSDVDVLYVPETMSLTANSDNTSSNYTTYNLSLSKYTFTGDSCVIPANTPVILATRTKRGSDSGSKLEADTITLDYYSNTIIKWTDICSTSDTIASAMTPSIPYEAAPNYAADDGKSYNFVFGYRKLNDTDTKPTIGFYYPTSGNIAINGAYLNVDSEYLSSNSSAKEAALVFYSDLTDADETDGSETTGINNALAAGDADADGAYYTLQGMRIAKPTVKGIYIHNGKKMIVK